MQVVRGEEKYEVADGHDWFWPQFADGSWEPATFKIFDKFLKKNERMVDIGAWIGPTALYAAKRAKMVFAFEPDATAYFSLIKNLALNKIDNVIPYPVAVSNEWRGLPFGAKNAYGDSMSSELWAKEGESSLVPAISFETVLIHIQPSFIKIDIEGGEKNILDGVGPLLKAMRPTIYLSLHTPWHTHDLENFKKHITDGLAVYPYFYDENLQPIKLEDSFSITAFNAIVASFTKL